MADTVDLNVLINLKTNSAGAKEAQASIAGVKTEAGLASTSVTGLGTAHQGASVKATEHAASSKAVSAETRQMEAGVRNSSRAVADLAGSMGGAGQAMGEMTRGASMSGSALQNLGVVGSAGGMLVAGGVVIAAAAVVDFGVKAVEAYQHTAQEVLNYSRITGESSIESSKQVEAFKLLGVSAEASEKGMFKFGKAIGANGDALKAFGVEAAKDNQGNVDLGGTLENVADAYTKIEDPAKRDELVFKAFGRAGKDMIPILEQGKDNLHALMEEMKTLYTDQDIRKAQEYAIAQRGLGLEWEHLSVVAGGTVVPALTDVTAGFAEVLAGETHLRDDQKLQEDANNRQVSGLLSWQTALRGIPAVALPMYLADLGKSTDDLNKKVADASVKSQQQATADADQAAAVQVLNTALVAEFTAMDKVNTLEVSRISSVLGAKAAQESYTAALKTHTATNTSLEQSAVSAATAIQKQAEEEATLNGKSLTSTESTQKFKDALITMAKQASGPVRDDLLKLAATIDPIKDPTVIPVTVTGVEAAERALLRLQGEKDKLALGGAASGGQFQRAEGGPTLPGVIYEVGERGRELWMSKEAGTIIPHAQTEQMLASGMGGRPLTTAGGNSIGNVTININGADKEPRQVALEVRDILLREQRNNPTTGIR